MKAYPAEFRAQVVAYANAHGVRRAIDQFHLPVTTVDRWAHPQHAERSRAYARAYKQRMRGECIDCGAATALRRSGGGHAKRCRACNLHEQARRKRDQAWTAEQIVDALIQWRAYLGRTPRRMDWATVKDDGPLHPCATPVYRVFGSWPGALLAAGLNPNRRVQQRRRAAN